MNRREHWDGIYSTKAPEELSWYQRHPELAVELIEHTGVDRDAAIIDVGGGDSLLVDHLLKRGYHDLTVLDVSAAALQRAKQRLGPGADAIRWVACDVTEFQLDRVFDLWHDRAVFHFLTEAEDRRRYLAVMKNTLADQGHAVIATFSPEGPAKCSGLDVQRYSATSLSREVGPWLKLVESLNQTHRTPAGREQAFVYCRFKRPENRARREEDSGQRRQIE